MKIIGSAAKDVAYNFIQRWNHHKESNNDYSSHPFILPTPSSKSPIHPSIPGTANVQLLRSISPWSSGNTVEDSLCKAYIDLIKNAEYFVYIENQFFISGTAVGVINGIGQAIVDRVARAIREESNFKIIVVMPVVPEGVYEETASIRYIMRWQFDTIWNGPTSIYGQLKQMFPDINPSDYISFHSLRCYGELEGSEVTEQIYIHAKLIIVDDCRAMISSANINDRSLRGDGDSEIGALVDDTSVVDSIMDGEPFKAAKFAFELRKQLWQEHLGLADSECSLIDDPISPGSIEYWKYVSSANTEVYTNAFPHLPSNHITTLQQLSSASLEPKTTQRMAILQEIRGHLIDFPLEFLKHENMKPDLKLKVVDRIFQ
eukprot:TRINITY_DN3176_c0_g1_i5.p1 TRINITY_DN3176_c0_g1~~TRINITY_DN3176_c0_g1_i5.p1  ORF type:complete len:374 (+),score=84.44 TRINITY_DN3176_c0_g1_i5:898-2019(+)